MGLVPNVVRQMLYLQSVNKMKNDLSKLSLQLDQDAYCDGIKKRLDMLYSSIANIRQLNYRGQATLETETIKAAELWMSTEASLKKYFSNGWADATKHQIFALSQEVAACEGTSEYYQGDINSLRPLEKRVAAYQKNVSKFKVQLDQCLSNLYSCLTSLEQRVAATENAINLTTKAAFKLNEKEIPLLVLKGKDMNKKIEVFLTLTNRRIIYESTAKDLERQLLFARPLKDVSKIMSDKFGLLARDGLCVEFKQAGDSPLKLTADKQEVGLAIQCFETIASSPVTDELMTEVSRSVEERFNELKRNSDNQQILLKKQKEEEAKKFEEIKGKCETCGTILPSYRKKWTNETGEEIGLYDCPICEKSFQQTLRKKAE